MLNENKTNVLKQDPMKVKPYARAVTMDMIDWESEVQKCPNILILHCRTNNVTNGIKTINKIKNLVKKISKIDTKVFTLSAISGLVERKNCLLTK